MSTAEQEAFPIRHFCALFLHTTFAFRKRVELFI